MTNATFIQDRHLGLVPLLFTKLGTAAGEAGPEQHVDLTRTAAGIELVIQGESAQSKRHRMVAARLLGAGDKVTGVADQQAGRRDTRGAGLVAADRAGDLAMFGQQLDQLEASEVDIVIFSCGDQMNLHDWTSPSHRRTSRRQVPGTVSGVAA